MRAECEFAAAIRLRVGLARRRLHQCEVD